MSELIWKLNIFISLINLFTIDKLEDFLFLQCVTDKTLNKTSNFNRTPPTAKL